jgi:hypothetical protein
LIEHSNTQRVGYAVADEGGVVLCTWPKGNSLTLPMVYCSEIFTGVEYQAAAHMISKGLIEQGLEIVRTCRDRYDGSIRNPFDEYECGHWYARAMASYSLIQALTGIRYDAVEKTLYINPVIEGDFKCFLCTATGYGTVGLKKGTSFIEVHKGRILIDKVIYNKMEVCWD